MMDVNQRVAEVVELAVANLTNIGMAHDDALLLLLVQAAVRLPNETIRRALASQLDPMGTYQ